MSTYTRTIAFCLVAASVGCTASTGAGSCGTPALGADVVSPPEAGAYDYLACDSGGQALVTGIVILSVTDTTVAGHWDLRRIPWGDPEIPVGPQVGTGQLEGRVRSDTLVLELNPDAVDYNLGLVGTPARGGAIAGEWTYITIAGPRNAGPFTMRPR